MTELCNHKYCWGLLIWYFSCVLQSIMQLIQNLIGSSPI